MTEQIPLGYKKTEIGIIPEDWEVKRLGEVGCIIGGGTPNTNKSEYWNGEINWFTPTEIGGKKYVLESKRKISYEGLKYSSAKLLPPGTILFTSRATIGEVAVLKKESATNQGFQSIIPKDKDNEFLYYLLLIYKNRFEKIANGSTFLEISPKSIKNFSIQIPPLSEQRAIARVLSDFDKLIESLDRLIEKKKLIKKGAMQVLLTGKKRLPGFKGEWVRKRLGEVTDCLDDHRIPLNESQRKKMRGTIPYCGANGILDYVNDYTIDDDIILLAEDGSQSDEFEEKPIAYRMKGKCWVNNHAHIIKAKEGYSQDFLFYSLVHKDIREYIGGGTRSKLNKSEMFKIEIDFPSTLKEQRAIAQILSDMDAEIEALERKKQKYEMIKRGAMELLL
ncbi:MAG TPA: restriction endonuclease subunit S, partial [Candidatus Atribacteria bacterium]|nr:restriction endonuclease subunit S [Candidatus Atribacteria bacterium]